MADSSVEVKVLGFDQLLSGTEKLAENIQRSAAGAFQRVADERAGQIRGVMPKVSGALAASVVTAVMDDRAELGFGGPEVPYAGWIEYGGFREGGRNSWAERPYLPGGRYFWPLASSAGDEVKAAGEQTASEEIGRMTWPTPRE